MFNILKSVFSVFTSTRSTSGGEPMTSSKKIWFNVSSAVTLVTPIVGLALGLATFKEVFDYMQIIFPVAATTYAVGKYVDGNNYAKTKGVNQGDNQ